ncbi:cupin domain-containing protein [Amphibiibacter pelophylacis]|uniref:AraC family transcriptional regulator n=1 Tax=Amphibiibacter pelophylacis TaxID=1799477 RepID=A0ACC6P2F5_9BURK
MTLREAVCCTSGNQKFKNNCNSYEMTETRLDRLSALMEGLSPRVTLFMSTHSRLDAGNPLPGEAASLWLYPVTRGAVWLDTRGRRQRIEPPALVALRSDQPHVLTRHAGADPDPLICAQVGLTGPVATLFLEEFAQARILALSDDEPALRLALALIEAELDVPRCGQPALLGRAGDILFIGVLRHLVARPGGQERGLFRGLADARIARALVAIHQRPSWGWDLERLAHEAGMSRTAFATTFREVMKRTPGRYLSALRLAIAQRAVDQGKGLKEAARTAGYANPSALSRALTKARLQGPAPG